MFRTHMLCTDLSDETSVLYGHTRRQDTSMGNPRSTLSTSMPHRVSRALAAAGSEQASALRSSLGFSVWISCPRPTMRRLTSPHTSRGIHASSAARVFSGVLVTAPLLADQPSWLAMRSRGVERGG